MPRHSEPWDAHALGSVMAQPLSVQIFTEASSDAKRLKSDKGEYLVYLLKHPIGIEFGLKSMA